MYFTLIYKTIITITVCLVLTDTLVGKKDTKYNTRILFFTYTKQLAPFAN